MSEAALERSDPELASAVKKLERMNAASDPRRAQQAMSQLSAAERKAVLDATMGQHAQEQVPDEPRPAPEARAAAQARLAAWQPPSTTGTAG